MSEATCDSQIPEKVVQQEPEEAAAEVILSDNKRRHEQSSLSPNYRRILKNPGSIKHSRVYYWLKKW